MGEMIKRCYSSGPASGATKRGEVGSPMMTKFADARGKKRDGQWKSQGQKNNIKTEEEKEELNHKGSNGLRKEAKGDLAEGALVLFSNLG